MIQAAHRAHKWLLCAGVLVSFHGARAEPPGANWRAGYSPCMRHSELLKRGPMNLGVRVATANPALADQFRRAMNFWSAVVDLAWYEDSTPNCSIQVVDGTPALFTPDPETMAARAQIPGRPGFQGSIAFNPALKLDQAELYRISIHEIGHMLGLQHSSSVKSLMYSFDLEGSEWLDSQDLASLAAHHKLRAGSVALPITWAVPRL